MEGKPVIIRTIYAADGTRILAQDTLPEHQLSNWFNLADNPAVRVTVDRLDGTSVVLTRTA
jgi:hypothetical protein